MKRRIGLLLVFGAALPLAAVSTAWACGVLATLTLDTKVAAPGQAVTATGKNYSTAGNASAVTIRLKTRTGRIIETTTPNSTNRINTTFSLPSDLSPGWYVVLATQTVGGVVKSGTPGRTTLRIQGSGAAAAAPTPWSATPAGPAGSPPVAGDGAAVDRSTLPIVLAMLLSLTMLASGWTLVGRARRSVSGPQLSV
jgi:hypothetical protein